MDWVYPYPARKVCPWIPNYQYPLVPIPESYPNILSMDIHTLPETHLILFLIQNILMKKLKTNRSLKKKKLSLNFTENISLSLSFRSKYGIHKFREYSDTI